MIVREVIHHGQYRKERDIRVESVADMVKALRDCTYWYHPDNADRLFRELSENGKTEHGWTRWKVVR